MDILQNNINIIGSLEITKNTFKSLNYKSSKYFGLFLIKQEDVV